LFFIAAIGALGGAIGVVMLRNPFYSVLSLVVHLIALAALFLLLRAEFVAAAQVVVYAGAVMVLYVFVVAYVGGQDEPLTRGSGALKAIGPLFALALAVELWIAILGSALKGISAKGAPFIPGFGTPAHIGRLFLTKYLFPFEVASLLLLVAAIGAVVRGPAPARPRRRLGGHRSAATTRRARRRPGRWPRPPGSGARGRLPPAMWIRRGCSVRAAHGAGRATPRRPSPCTSTAARSRSSRWINGPTSTTEVPSASAASTITHGRRSGSEDPRQRASPPPSRRVAQGRRAASRRAAGPTRPPGCRRRSPHRVRGRSTPRSSAGDSPVASV